jgi:hypothetical protein
MKVMFLPAKRLGTTTIQSNKPLLAKARPLSESIAAHEVLSMFYSGQLYRMILSAGASKEK